MVVLWWRMQNLSTKCGTLSSALWHLLCLSESWASIIPPLQALVNMTVTNVSIRFLISWVKISTVRVRSPTLKPLKLKANPTKRQLWRPGTSTCSAMNLSWRICSTDNSRAQFAVHSAIASQSLLTPWWPLVCPYLSQNHRDSSFSCPTILVLAMSIRAIG